MKRYNYHLSVPSKTFLLGEYYALVAGAGIILNTSPRFTLIASENDSFQKESSKPVFPLQSPAEQWLEKNKQFYQRFAFEWHDGHEGRGGFGASSAQFILLVSLKHLVERELPLTDTEWLSLYRALAWRGLGMPPSGLDLLAQITGGLTYFNLNKKEKNSFSWPFLDLNYAIIHTGNKLATYAYLEKIKNIEVQDAAKIIELAYLSLFKKDKQLFLTAIREYAVWLKLKNWVATETQILLSELSRCKDILAAKGCGAMGADVIILFYDQGNEKVISWLKEKRMNIVFYGNQTEVGLKAFQYD